VNDDQLVIVNFGHPVIEAQKAQIEVLTGQSVTRVLDVPTQVDVERALEPQVATLVGQVPLSFEEWRVLDLLIILPGLAPLAAVLLAHLHGRMGHFPTMIRLCPARDAQPLRFDVAELIDLQTVRQNVRSRR
jgi:hypothetical protein